MSIQVKYNYFQIDKDRNRGPVMNLLTVMDEGASVSSTPV